MALKRIISSGNAVEKRNRFLSFPDYFTDGCHPFRFSKRRFLEIVPDIDIRYPQFLEFRLYHVRTVDSIQQHHIRVEHDDFLKIDIAVITHIGHLVAAAPQSIARYETES